MLKRVVGLMMGCLGMSCLRISDQPTRPVTSECDSPTSSDIIDSIDPKNEKSSSSSSGRIKLSDGRYLAYKERGVPKNESTYRVVIVHGFASNKEMNFMATQVHIDQPLFVFNIVCVECRSVCIFNSFVSKLIPRCRKFQKLMDELEIYLVRFDRAGYGDSDPNPKRSFKSESSDIQELADQLQLDIFGAFSSGREREKEREKDGTL